MKGSQLSFELVLVESGHRSSLYTVQFDHSDVTELEKWATDDRITSHPEFDGVYGALRSIPNEGVPDDYFFKSAKYRGWITPFVAAGYHELRLYCVKYDEHEWVIAGNGCIKDDDGPLQQFPRCRRTHRDIQYVDERVSQRLRGDDFFDLYAHESRLEGDFDFPPQP